MRKGFPVGVLLCALTSFFAASAAAQGIKWHPGHYVMFGTDDSKWQVLQNIQEIGDEPSIKGVQVRMRWHDLETSKGVYDFSAIDAYLAKLRAQPTRKQLVVRVIDRAFNTSSSGGIVPNYLLSSTYNGGIVRTKTGYVARLWEPAVMDRLIALHSAIGRRYDDDIRFEGLATEETTLSLNTPFPGGYSHAKLEAQYERLARAVRIAMPSSNFFLYTNWIGSADLMDDLLQSLVVPRAAAGGSNIFPGTKTLGQRVWTGEFGADYRWLLALSSSVEAGELRDYTPKQINDWAYNTLRLNHIFWVRNTWAGDASRRWDTGILPFLRTKPPIRTRCPDSISVCVRW
ncbi:MAG TPA: hypothetical protein VKA43_17565 [Gammaproteobacteria bacterium]|nr:hypothetical protein [Gammaproteobacteria bacterium]